MHCHICDADTDTLQIEGDGFSPCSDCQAAIFECLEGYPKIVDPADPVGGGPARFDLEEVLEKDWDV